MYYKYTIYIVLAYIIHLILAIKFFVLILLFLVQTTWSIFVEKRCHVPDIT